MNLAHWNKISKDLKVANHKWWYNEDGTPTNRTQKTLGTLIVSELCEGMEGVRKGLKDDHLPQYDMFAVELADAMIRSLDYISGNGIELVDYSETSTEWFSFKEIRRLENIHEVDDIYDLIKCTTTLVDSFRLQENDGTRYGNLTVKNTEKSAFVLIAAIDYVAEVWDIDLRKIVAEKIEYNANRADHKRENRDKENGKKF